MIKTFSFAAVHMTVAFTVVYLLTGDVLAGGAIALIEPLCNTVAYHFHERFWRRRTDNDPASAGPGINRHPARHAHA